MPGLSGEDPGVLGAWGKPERLKLSKVGAVKLEILEEIHARTCRPSKEQQRGIAMNLKLVSGRIHLHHKGAACSIEKVLNID